jgi:hypothetical protein
MTIEKITDGAYFVVDDTAFSSQIAAYDPTLATQTIALGTTTDVEMREPFDERLEASR